MSEENNVIQFPGKKTVEVKAEQTEEQKPLVTTEEIMEKSDKSASFSMQLIDKNRKKGLEQIQAKLESLTERKLHQDPATESALRDVQGAIQGMLTFVEAANSLLNFMKHDFIAMMENIEGISQRSWYGGAHTQALMNLLKDKKVFTEEEFKEVWNRDVVPMAKKLQELQDKANKGE